MEVFFFSVECWCQSPAFISAATLYQLRFLSTAYFVAVIEWRGWACQQVSPCYAYKSNGLSRLSVPRSLNLLNFQVDITHRRSVCLFIFDLADGLRRSMFCDRLGLARTMPFWTQCADGVTSSCRLIRWLRLRSQLRFCFPRR